MPERISTVQFTTPPQRGEEQEVRLLYGNGTTFWHGECDAYALLSGLCKAAELAPKSQKSRGYFQIELPSEWCPSLPLYASHSDAICFKRKNLHLESINPPSHESFGHINLFKKRGSSKRPRSMQTLTNQIGALFKRPERVRTPLPLRTTPNWMTDMGLAL